MRVKVWIINFLSNIKKPKTLQAPTEKALQFPQPTKRSIDLTDFDYLKSLHQQFLIDLSQAAVVRHRRNRVKI